MSLQLAINSALSGLNVNQAALSVVSQNIANVNTEGYTRKTLEQSAVYMGRDQTGAGVRIDDVVRKVDKYLNNSTRLQLSETRQTDVVNEYMLRLQNLLGRPGDVNTLDEYLKTFMNDLQRLADTPERTASRESAVRSGQILAREISGLAGAFEDLRLQADRDIDEGVERVNNLLAKLDNINVAIVNAGVLGNPVSGLQDEQDIIINEIAEFMDVQVLVQDTHEVFLYAASGVTLLDESAYELEYHGVPGRDDLVDGVNIFPINVYRLHRNGTRIAPPEQLSSGNDAVGGAVNTHMKGGSMVGLMHVRDTMLPAMVEQLDQIAAQIRDTFNAIHNNGSSFPGVNQLTGTRAVRAQEAYDWSGEMRISILDKNGEPVTSRFDNETHTGMRPLTLDLSKLNGGTGKGQPDVQTLIDEINNHFNPPITKVSLGNINNIQLATVTDVLPNGAPSTLEFDFDMDNISGENARIVVRDFEILNDMGVAAGTFTQGAPTFDITQTETFAGTNTARITATDHGVRLGDRVFIPAGGAGPQAGMFGRFFVVSSVTGTNTFEVALSTTQTVATTDTHTPRIGTRQYDSIEAGEKRRTNENGTFIASIPAVSPLSEYYDVRVRVNVFHETAPADSPGSESFITYRVYNETQNMRNDRHDHIAATGDAQRLVPNDNRPWIRAMLVDKNGVELPKSDGDYNYDEGYLTLVASDPTHTVAIDELTSKQLGVTTTVPLAQGTNRGFSHFFELNNFFKSNNPTLTGDTVKNSAITLDVEDRIKKNPNLISLGTTERTLQQTGLGAMPTYTYQRNKGANRVVQDLAKVSSTIMQFEPAGGLPTSRQSLSGYIGEVLAYHASKATAAELEAKDNQILLDGFLTRQDSINGVNVDEELANMILFQNAYSASARIISVADQMFEDLLQAV